MLGGGRARALAWKELLDLARDRKTLATSIMMPLIVFPLLGLVSLTLVSYQEVRVAIIDLDRSTARNPVLNITVSSRDLAESLYSYLSSKGYRVFYANTTSVVNETTVDLVVIIPPGFAENASSLARKAHVVVRVRTGVESAKKAEGDARAVIGWFSTRLAEEKVEGLIRYSGLNATIDAVMYPLTTRVEFFTIGGRRVGFEYELRNVLARVLVITLSVVVTPATSFIIEGVIGERERKTIEMLLSTPLPLPTLLYVKILSASLLGLITALADALGFIAYMILFSMALTGNPLAIPIDYTLLALHAVVAFFTILVTISMALPFITRTQGIRSAANIASAIAVVGTIMFFTGFIVDYTRLPQEIIRPLYAIPYTHSILAIQYYVLGYRDIALLHIGVLIALSTLLIAVSLKTVTTEKILIAPRT